MNTFIQQLQYYQPLIEDKLHQILEPTLQNYQATTRKQQIHDFVLHGGKRLRPILALLLANEWGFESEKYLDVFCALEIFHDFILSHDDIIDEDKIRRWTDTMRTAMSKNLAQYTIHNRIHFWRSQAIIGGDILYSLAQECILQSTIDTEKKLQLIQLLSTSFQDVAHGRYMQFLSDYMPISDVSLDYIVQHNLIEVTSSYSFVFPFQFGSILATGQNEIPKNLLEFAYKLGITYQVSDDLIGLFGDEQSSWKSNSGDIIQWKKTIPMYYTYQHASKSEQQFLLQRYGATDLTEQEIQRIKNLIQNYGLELTQKFLTDNYTAARRLLDSLPYSSSWKEIFSDLLDFLMERKA